MASGASPTVETRPAPAGFWNVPNTLTVGRMALVPVVCACIAYQYYAWALVIFILASITDALDGYLARLLNQVTPVGRQLDPLVDKVIVASCFIYLLPIPDTGFFPWMLATIVVRELIVQALRSLIEGRGEPFGARTAGKLKTLFQCLSIGAILTALVLGLAADSRWLWLRDGFTWIAVALTVYSGFGYLKLAWPKLTGERPL